MKDYKYYISVVRRKDYGIESKVLDESDKYFEYASYDRYAGSMSTGYPCMTSTLGQAQTFETVEAAEAWWNKEKQFITGYYNNGEYDWATLGIRKMIFKKVKNLSPR